MRLLLLQYSIPEDMMKNVSSIYRTRNGQDNFLSMDSKKDSYR